MNISINSDDDRLVNYYFLDKFKLKSEPLGCEIEKITEKVNQLRLIISQGKTLGNLIEKLRKEQTEIEKESILDGTVSSLKSFFYHLTCGLIGSNEVEIQELEEKQKQIDEATKLVSVWSSVGVHVHG